MLGSVPELLESQDKLERVKSTLATTQKTLEPKGSSVEAQNTAEHSLKLAQNELV